MRSLSPRLLSMLVAVAAATVAGADVFDTAPTNDNTAAGTKNELVHASDQMHDLAALPGPLPDSDWYRLSQKPYASYEVVVETTSSAIGPTLQVELVNSAGVPVGPTAVPISSLGFSRSLRWHNGGTLTPPTSPIDDQYIRVQSGQCTTNCTANDVYRIRFYETTQFAPRFNNMPTQYTYYFLQNTTDYAIQTRVYFWGAGTILCQSQLIDIPARATAIFDDDTLFQRWPGGADVALCATGRIEDVAGHLILVSNARYGDLRCQGAALDPNGTQLELDTDMTSRPR